MKDKPEVKKKLIVVSKGDFGVPNPTLYGMLNPVNKDKCVKQPEPRFRLVKGEEYEFTGDEALLRNKDGLQKLLEVKKNG